MIATFPTIYDDELVYSILCRFYDHSGILSFRYAAESLFQNKLSRPTIEFLNAYTDDALSHLLRKCNMETLILKHTMATYYMRFLDLPRRTAAMQALTAMDNQYWKNLNLPVNRRKTSEKARLRYCLLCSKEDRERYGETYWHTCHQLRHIDVCPVHGCYLQDSEVIISTEGTPSLISAESVVPYQYDTTQCENALQLRLTRFAHEVFCAPIDMKSTVTTGAFFKSRLEGTPYISVRGERRNISLLYRDFFAYYASLPNSPINETWQVEKIFCNQNHSFVPICMMALFLGISVEELCSPSLPEKTQAQRFDEEVMRLHALGLKYPAIAKRMNAKLELVKKTGEGRATCWYTGEKRRTWSPNSGPKRLDYDTLDSEYLPKVKAVAAEMYGQNGNRPRRVTVLGIETRLSIPTYRLSHCPRCMRVIKQYMETQEEYWAREAVWCAKELMKEGVPLSQTRFLQKINLRQKNYERCIPYLNLYADGELLDKLQNVLIKGGNVK